MKRHPPSDETTPRCGSNATRLVMSQSTNLERVGELDALREVRVVARQPRDRVGEERDGERRDGADEAEREQRHEPARLAIERRAPRDETGERRERRGTARQERPVETPAYLARETSRGLLHAYERDNTVTRSRGGASGGSVECASGPLHRSRDRTVRGVRRPRATRTERVVPPGRALRSAACPDPIRC